MDVPDYTAFLGITAALISSASWAIGAVLFQRLGESLSSLAMTLVKGAMSVVLLGLVWLAVSSYEGFTPIQSRPLILLAISGVLGIAVADTFFFEALRSLGARPLIVIQTLGFVLPPVFAMIFLKERLNPVQWMGILMIAGGIIVVIAADLAKEDRASRMSGILLGLASVTCMSISFVIAKPALDSVSALQAAFLRLLAGTTGMLILGLSMRRVTSWITPFQNLKLTGRFFLAVSVVTFGGFWLSLFAMKHLPVSVATPLNSTEPLFVLPVAAIFLKERITFRAAAGSVAAVLGVVLLCFPVSSN